MRKLRLLDSEPMKREYPCANSEAVRWLGKLQLLIAKYHSAISEPQVSKKQHNKHSEPTYEKKHRDNSDNKLFPLKRHTLTSEPITREKRRLKSEPKPRESRRRISEFGEQIRSRSLEELINDIKKARDKAYDEEHLTLYEQYLFDAFMKSGTEIKQLAKTLKRRAEK